MNKYIIEALKDYNFEWDKNTGYGIIDGYEVNVVNSNTEVGPLFVFSTYLAQNKKNEFVMKINSYKYPLVQSNYFNFGVCVRIGSMTGKSFVGKCNKVLPTILSILKELEAPKKDVCPQSGEVLDLENSKVVPLDRGVKIRMSNQSVSTLNSMIEKYNEEYENAPNNYLKGFLGILIGALAGVLTTVLFSYLGIITALSSLISIFLGTYLYDKVFGGKKNIVMIVMSIATTTIAILFTVVIMYTVVATTALEVNFFSDGFDALKLCLSEVEEFRRLFIMDIILNVVFILLGSGISLFRLLKIIKRPKTI